MNFPTPILGEIIYRGGMNFWWALALAIVAVILVAVVYLRESMKMNPLQRIAMAALRCLAILGIIFLLRKPVIVSDIAADKTLPIAVLIDNSQSMNQRDPRTAPIDRERAAIAFGEFNTPNDDAKLPTRFEVVKAVFQNPELKLRQGLASKGPLQEYFFGSSLHGAGKDWEKSDKPAEENQTALLSSINELLKRDENDLPSAIVVATDGIDNSSKTSWESVAKICKKLGVPLHIYGVAGGVTPMLRLKSVAVKDTVLMEDEVRVPFHWKSQGITSGDVILSLTLDGVSIASKTIAAKEGEDIDDYLNFILTKKNSKVGKHEIIASIKQVGGKQEDALVRNVQVVESKVKVLYVESSPRWEFKFLQRYLNREWESDAKGDKYKSVEATYILTSTDDREKTKVAPPFMANFPRDRRELFAYDMIIIGDVDSKFFTDAQLKLIVEFVEEGGGLVMIAGRRANPATYLNTPLAKIMPIEFEAKKFPIDDAQKQVLYQPKLSDMGQREPMMMLGDNKLENQKTWAKLPGWFWYYPIKELKPLAFSLLDHPKDEIDDPLATGKEKKRPMPLISLQTTSKNGSVMFFATDETWRWRFNEADKVFGRFWGQVIYKVGVPHMLGNKSQFIPTDTDFIKGEEGRVYARLFTTDNHARTDAKVMARLERNGGVKKGEEADIDVAFTPVKNQPGVYSAPIKRSQAGDYTLRFSESFPDSPILPIRVSYSTEDEQAPGNLNEAALTVLASNTDGKFYREGNLKDLVGEIKTKTVKLNPPPRRETLLWTRWYALAAIVALLTLEWLIRKFSNLS